MRTGSATKARARRDAALYDADFFKWTQRTAQRLRQRDFDEVDIEHAAEEIEDMGKRERRELSSRMGVLLGHLLKWKLQPHKRSNSWRATIVTQRQEIAAGLKDSPSLRRRLVAAGETSYQRAVERAAAETGIDIATFPPECPFSIEEILNLHFLPE